MRFRRLYCFLLALKQKLERLQSHNSLSLADPCLSAAWDNHVLSRLLRLPDALLVAIMIRLDVDDVLRLRHTSRTFMRLFSESTEFQKLHLTRHEDEDRMLHLARVWAVPRRSIHPPSYKDPWKLCRRCQSIRQERSHLSGSHSTKSTPFMYCSGCRLEHRAFYFSPRQRHRATDNERICIGREYPFVLCDHISVTWDAVNRLANCLPGENTIKCNNRQHVNASECSHVRSSTQSWSCCPHEDRPQLKAWRNDDGELCLEIFLTVHIPFRPDKSMKNDRVRSRDFQYIAKRAVTRCSPVFPSAWLLTSYFQHGNDFMKAFDPNICSCLDWGAEDLLYRDNSETEFAWRLSTNPMKPWRERPVPESDLYTGADKSHRAPGDKCAGFKHGITLDISRTKTTRRLDFHKCDSNPGFLVMKQTFERRVCSAYDYAWVVDLEYPLFGPDREMQGIAYCAEPRCRFVQRKEAWRQLNAHRGTGMGIVGGIDEHGVEGGGKGGDHDEDDVEGGDKGGNSHSTATQTLLTTSVINSISLY
ncbi:hypothetical protein B0T11DRAFT_16437 [Plectosphaerella cucumerina]|uniref:F-box domain-containing protein n=1 Tax=Plectosphaerella cucumerina TaxID=40658 RepID=A0A8K0X8Q3_9PEZI|nr:hypothetical protein B0T11DRAFT_16437 [Plectosphaerella cucumerina]